MDFAASRAADFLLAAFQEKVLAGLQRFRVERNAGAFEEARQRPPGVARRMLHLLGRARLLQRGQFVKLRLGLLAGLAGRRLQQTHQRLIGTAQTFGGGRGVRPSDR